MHKDLRVKNAAVARKTILGPVETADYMRDGEHFLYKI